MNPTWHEWVRYKRGAVTFDRAHEDLKLRLHRALRQQQMPSRGVPKIRLTPDERIKLVVVTTEAPEAWWPTRFEAWDIEYTKALPASFRASR